MVDVKGVGFATARDEAIASRSEIYKIYREAVNQKQTDNGEQMREGSCELTISKLPTPARHTSTVEADERRLWFLQNPL